MSLHPAGIKNLKLTLAYDGTAYLGWQKTAMGPSIEETLQRAIEQIAQHPIALQAASRTDAGVHANGQVVNFLTPKSFTSLPKLLVSLNQLLPKNIAVRTIEWAPLSFHPTLDAKGKEYHYHVCLGPFQLPQHRLYSWHFPYSFSFDRISQALPLLIGEYDCSAFCNQRKGMTYPHFIRRITAFEWRQLEEGRLSFFIRGTHFVYKMVRNLVGTVMAVGRGHMSLEELKQAIALKQRTLAGMTAPAHGLTLHRVFYHEEEAISLT